MDHKRSPSMALPPGRRTVGGSTSTPILGVLAILAWSTDSARRSALKVATLPASAVIAGTGNVDTGDVVAYEIGGTYANAAAVATAIVSNGGSFIDFLTSGHTFDLLVAYANTAGGTNIADIQLDQNLSFTTFGANVTNTADLVTLSGVGLGKIIGTVLGSNDVVHFNGA